MRPPFAFIVLDTFRLAVLTVVVLIIIVDNVPTTFKFRPAGTIIPPFAVINPEILAEPTTSSGTVGDKLPIPKRDEEPPIIYMLLWTMALVPNCAIGIVESVLLIIKLELSVVRPRT